MTVETILIHPSLVQPILVAGAEREYTILMGIMAVMLWIAGKSLIAFLLAISTWVIGMAIGRWVAKRDAQGLKIWLRHMQYRDMYPASEKLGCAIRQLKLFKV